MSRVFFVCLGKPLREAAALLPRAVLHMRVAATRIGMIGRKRNMETTVPCGEAQRIQWKENAHADVNRRFLRMG